MKNFELTSTEQNTEEYSEAYGDCWSEKTEMNNQHTTANTKVQFLELLPDSNLKQIKLKDIITWCNFILRLFL